MGYAEREPEMRVTTDGGSARRAMPGVEPTSLSQHQAQELLRYRELVAGFRERLLVAAPFVAGTERPPSAG